MGLYNYLLLFSRFLTTPPCSDFVHPLIDPVHRPPNPVNVHIQKKKLFSFIQKKLDILLIDLNYDSAKKNAPKFFLVKPSTVFISFVSCRIKRSFKIRYNVTADQNRFKACIRSSQISSYTVL